MYRIIFGILVCMLISSAGAQGQSRKNPFELLHRKGNQTAPASMPADTAGKTKDTVSPNPATIPLIPADSHAIDTGIPGEPIEEEAAPGNIFENFTDSTLVSPTEATGDIAAGHVEEPAEMTGPGKGGMEESEKQSESNVGHGDSMKLGEFIPALPQKIVKRKKLSGAFMALIFLGILLLLTIIVNINRKLLHQVYRASLNENFSALLYRERKHSSFNYLYSIAYVIFFINAGLFIYQSQFLDIWYHPATYALWVFILLPVVIYSTRHLVMRLLATVFPISKEINQFNFNIIVFNIIIGLFLIPVNLFIAFGPSVLHLPIVYTSIVAIGLFYIFRQLRGVLIATPLVNNNLFLFFIYLCTVEILPLAVIFKLLA